MTLNDVFFIDFSYIFYFIQFENGCVSEILLNQYVHCRQYHINPNNDISSQIIDTPLIGEN